ncbi:hypothetical protein HY029_05650 [Candidatus Gottesmanbacteria bacterium]|nr:hypothetical protein [Candidatus Gottesmanbacteria bacterium]
MKISNLFSLLINKVFACDPSDPGCAIGKLSPLPGMDPGIDPITGQFTGIVVFLNSILRLVFIVAGIWAFLNFIIAGYGFMNAGGDGKNITKAWDRIWQTFLGLLVIVASFLLAAIAGILIFHNAGAILNPTLGGAPGAKP